MIVCFINKDYYLLKCVGGRGNSIQVGEDLGGGGGGGGGQAVLILNYFTAQQNANSRVKN